MGGATTDIFTVKEGHFHRTVSANLGMSYSVRNAMVRAGLENVTRWLDDEFDPEDVCHYVNNKMCHPSHLPATEAEVRVEQALAREIVALALDDHLEKAPSVTEKSGVGMSASMQDAVSGRVERTLDVRDADLILGSGGHFANSGTYRDRALTLIDGLKPTGVVELAVDPHFITPHLGVLGQVMDSEKVHGLFEDLAMRRLGLLVRPEAPRDVWVEFSDGSTRHYERGKIHFDHVDDDVRIRAVDGVPGYSEERALSPGSHSDVPFNLIVDLREEPDQLSAGRMEFSQFETSYAVEEGPVCYRVPLPEDVRFQVQKGDPVDPSTVLAMVRRHVTFPWYVYPCSTLNIDPEELPEAMVKDEGDVVQKSEVIARSDVKMTVHEYKSPVRGEIKRISSTTGRVTIEEQLDEREVTVDVAEKLGVDPGQICDHLKVEVGDRVLEGTVLAVERPDSLVGFFFDKVNAPLSGTVAIIEDGKVTISRQGPRHPVYPDAYGKVECIEDDYIEITAEGYAISGVFGVGSRVAGRLRWAESLEEMGPEAREGYGGCVVVVNRPLTPSGLKWAEKVGVAGILCPSAAGNLLDDYVENSITIGVEGNREMPVSICLLKGFGKQGQLPAEIEYIVSEKEGNPAVLDGTTQIRAGVVRPYLHVHTDG